MAVDKSFVVKNGLEVNSDLIVADASSKKVGIASTGPRSTLDVRGGIAATDGNFTGILTAATLDVADFGVINASNASVTGFTTLGGLTVDQLTVTGFTTITDISLDEVSLRNLTITGVATVPTFTGLTSFSRLKTTGISTIPHLDSTNANVSGIATIATVDINAGSVEVSSVITSDLNVSGVTTIAGYPNFTGGATVVGVVTATSFSGAGQIGIGSADGVVGYGVSFLEFIGAGVSAISAPVSGIATIHIAGGGGSGGSASIGVGSTPGDAFSGIITSGNLWYNTDLGRLFIYYQDDGSAQWVDAAPFNVGIITQLTSVSFNDGSVTDPSLTFGTDQNSGFFSPADGSISFSSNTSGIVTFNSGGVDVNGIVTATSFVGDGSGLTGVASTDNIQTSTEAEFISGIKISGVSTFSGEIDANAKIVATATDNVIPFLYSTLGDLPSASTYHGAFAHVHSEGKAYYAHAGNWVELVNKETDGITGTGSENYNVGVITATTVQVGTALTLSTDILDGGGTVNILGNNLNLAGVATAQDFDSLSDANFKDNIETVSNALEKVDSLRGVRFNWKRSGTPAYGVIAQELEQVLPELVHGGTGADPKTVNYNGIIGVLIESIKELSARVTELEGRKN